MTLLTDFGPLRSSPDFRRLWASSSLSSIGGALSTFAVPLQIFELTHSSLAVGGLGVATVIPLVSVGLVGGHISDSFDRRRVLAASTACSAAISLGLTLQVVAGSDSIWLLYLLWAGRSACAAVGGPSRRALVPEVLSRDQLAGGLALNRIAFQVSIVLGPALGGLLASLQAGLPACYLLDTVCLLTSFWAVMGLPAAKGGQQRLGASRMADGLRLIRRNPPLIGALITDLVAVAFALPVVLFPAINAGRFGANPQTLGLFMAAIGLGGLITSILSGPFTRAERQGALMLGSVAVWGAAFAGFALVRSLWATLCLLGLAGAADAVTVVLRGALIQTNAPPHARGRISAAEYLISGTGSYLGDLGSGALASITTARTSALAGALTTIAGTLVISVTLPGFSRYRQAAPLRTPRRLGSMSTRTSPGRSPS